jgi:hypothetical protein
MAVLPLLELVVIVHGVPDGKASTTCGVTAFLRLLRHSKHPMIDSRRITTGAIIAGATIAAIGRGELLVC